MPERILDKVLFFPQQRKTPVPGVKRLPSNASPDFPPIRPESVCKRQNAVPGSRVYGETSMFGTHYGIPKYDMLRRTVLQSMRPPAIFFKEFITAPRHVGSICPSSRALTTALARMAPAHDDGLVIDLGAGSGIVTERLLRIGIAPERILAVELSPRLAEICRQRCPEVTTLTGDARDLAAMLAKHVPGKRIACIISSLPFRVMPAGQVREILRAVRFVLKDRGGFLVQYTYAWWQHSPLRRYNFSPLAVQIVLFNCPPAKVETYTA